MSVNVEVRDKISSSISKKLAGIATQSEKAASSITRLNTAMASISGQLGLAKGAAGLRLIGTSASSAQARVAGLTASLTALRGSFASIGRGIRGFISGVLLLGAFGGVLKGVDAYQTLENQIRQTTKSQGQLNAVMKSLFTIAKDTRTPVGDLAKLYRRVDRAMRNMGRGQVSTERVVGAVAGMIKLSGATAQEASSAMLQLSQAFNKGKLDGDEFRTVAELMPQVIDALSKSLGISIADIYKWSRAGKINSEALGNALESASEGVAEKVKKMPRTIGDYWTNFKNQVIESFGALDKSINITDKIGGMIEGLGNNLPAATAALVGFGTAITAIAVGGAIGGLVTFFGSLSVAGGLAAGVSALAVGLTAFAAAAALTGQKVTLANGEVVQFSSVLKGLGGLASGDLQRIKEAFTGIGTAAQETNIETWEQKFASAANSVGNILINFRGNALGSMAVLGQVFQITAEALKTAFTNVPLAIGAAFFGIVNIAQNAMKLLMEVVLSGWNVMRQKMGQGLEPIGAAIKLVPGLSELGTVLEETGKILQKPIDGTAVFEDLDKAIGASKDEMNSLIDKMGNLWDMRGKYAPLEETFGKVKAQELQRSLKNIAIEEQKRKVLEQQSEAKRNQLRQDDEAIQGQQALLNMQGQISDKVEEINKLYKDSKYPSRDMLAARAMEDYLKPLDQQQFTEKLQLEGLNKFMGSDFTSKLQNLTTQIRTAEGATTSFGNKFGLNIGKIIDGTNSAATQFDSFNNEITEATPSLKGIGTVLQPGALGGGGSELEQVNQAAKALASSMPSAAQAVQTLKTSLAGIPTDGLNKISAAANAASGSITAIGGAASSAALNIGSFSNSAVNNLNQITAAALKAANAISGINTGGTSGNTPGQGYSKGGYTGSGGRNQIAGVVHGQEYVMPASQTAKYRPLLDAMRSGSASPTASAGSPGMKVNIQNYGGGAVQTRQLSDDEILVIIGEQAKSAARIEGPKAVARTLSNPNSSVSKSLARNTKAGRRR